MNLTLKIWRQKDAGASGALVAYKIENVSPDMSFLEMLDVLNERLVATTTAARASAACARS